MKIKNYLNLFPKDSNKYIFAEDALWDEDWNKDYPKSKLDAKVEMYIASLL